MQMLYDSDTFVVLHMQPDLGQPEKILLSDGKTETPALPRHGFEIVDKRTGKEVYLDGEWAELFQRQIRAWQIDFVQNRNDFQVIFQGQIQITNRLCLNTLRSIYDQKRTFTSGDRSRYFVGEINVTRSVDQIENIFFSIQLIIHLYCVRFYGNSAFFFQIHIIQSLRLQFSLGNGIGVFQKPVSQGRFSVVDMCNDAKVSYVFH